MAPTSSALQPTECVVVDVTFDSTGLALDVYNAALDVNSNDPDEPVIELPAQLTVVAPAITLDKTVGAVPGVCAPYDTIDIPVGIEVFYCYTVENVGDATFTYHTLNDTELGVLLFDEPIVLDPGESYSYVHTGVVITETVVNTGTWYAYLSQGGYYVSAVDQATVTALFPAITLDKTVGLGPECATTDSLTVPAGTEVTFCYEVTNIGDATLGVHDLSDDVLGDLLVGEEFDLEPGASHVFTTTAVVNVDTENTANWTAYFYEGGAGRKPLTALRWMSTLLRSAWSRPSGWVRDVPRPIS